MGHDTDECDARIDAIQSEVDRRFAEVHQRLDVLFARLDASDLNDDGPGR